MVVSLGLQLATGLVASVGAQRRRAFVARVQAAHARAMADAPAVTEAELRSALRDAGEELERCGWTLQAHAGLTGAVLEWLVERR